LKALRDGNGIGRDVDGDGAERHGDGPELGTRRADRPVLFKNPR
jgi:hypothetical protein